MRVIDTLYAFPAILMALLLAAVFQPRYPHRHDRHRRRHGAHFCTADALVGAEHQGAGVHRSGGGRSAAPRRASCCATCCPTPLSPIVVQASLSLAVAVLAEAALSFLGLGTPPDVPSWGNMLREAQGFLEMSVYPALVPGLAIVVTVLGWSLLGDGLRDRLDPTSRD